MSTGADIVLAVQDLVAGFRTDSGHVRVLDRVSFTLQRGQTLGLVGESGCGKSITALSIMRLLPKPAGKVESGSITYDGNNLLDLPLDALYKIRGRRIAMIFQEPMTALNPVHRIGKQLAEVYWTHFPEMGDAAVHAACLDMLKKVGIPEAEKRLYEYPHQLSGGMRQRVMVAMALACKPDILIADEPTTALDVTIQAQILLLIKELQAEIGMSVIFITHDLGVVAQICDQVAVMYAGRIIEIAAADELFARPLHPYTKGLLRSIPVLAGRSKSKLNVIKGMVPALNNLPSGCRFRDRCEWAIAACAESVPPLCDAGGKHGVACIRWQELVDER
jgi:oligopeptide/dipeptide ABC transporter ATP-binding protein